MYQFSVNVRNCLFQMCSPSSPFFFCVHLCSPKTCSCSLVFFCPPGVESWNKAHVSDPVDFRDIRAIASRGGGSSQPRRCPVSCPAAGKPFPPPLAGLAPEGFDARADVQLDLLLLNPAKALALRCSLRSSSPPNCLSFPPSPL